MRNTCSMTAIKHICVLTGAGISAESGIKTFRDAGGLWEDHPVEDVATPEGFARDPDLVHRFYNERRAALTTAQPNAAHMALAHLEKALIEKGGALTLITQNVDDLHERGGSNHVIHMHGELLSALCQICRAKWRHIDAITPQNTCPKCKTVGGPRPDIVWFGEVPYFMDAIDTALNQCALFVSIGTSGAVYPAAGFVQIARRAGKQTLELNLERSSGSHDFDESRLGPASQLVPHWADEVIAAL